MSRQKAARTIQPIARAPSAAKWDQETAFPIIAGAIERLYRPDIDRYIAKREIVPLLLGDRKCSALIATAYNKKERKFTIETYAGNMVQWFSQRWTEGDEKWASLFKQYNRSAEQIDGCWAYKPVKLSAVAVYPDDVESTEVERMPEGAAYERFVNAFERNPLARQKCIEKYGSDCFVCGFSFGITYGTAVAGLIHVHHLVPLSKAGKDYAVDPIADLRPVCPNCHAVIHHRTDPPYSIEEVRSLLAQKT